MAKSKHSDKNKFSSNSSNSFSSIDTALLDELKEILEEDYKVKLSDKAVDRIASFLVNYVTVLKNIDMNSDDD